MTAGEKEREERESLRETPTRPIKRQGLFGIVVVDTVPIMVIFA